MAYGFRYTTRIYKNANWNDIKPNYNWMRLDAFRYLEDPAFKKRRQKAEQISVGNSERLTPLSMPSFDIRRRKK